jgi:crossover junction endodeoxyribonuclease RusA
MSWLAFDPAKGDGRKSELLCLRLPWPPSINNYYATFLGRRIVSREGRTYRKLINTYVGLARVTTRHERLGLLILAYPPDKRKRDLDNLLKPLLDALQSGGAFLDDSQIDDLRIKRMPICKGGKIEVNIESCEAQENEAMLELENGRHS